MSYQIIYIIITRIMNIIITRIMNIIITRIMNIIITRIMNRFILICSNIIPTYRTTYILRKPLINSIYIKTVSTVMNASYSIIAIKCLSSYWTYIYSNIYIPFYIFSSINYLASCWTYNNRS